MKSCLRIKLCFFGEWRKSREQSAVLQHHRETEAWSAGQLTIKLGEIARPHGDLDYAHEIASRISSWTVQREVGLAARNGCMDMADIERRIGVRTGHREIVVVTVEQIRRRRLS